MKNYKIASAGSPQGLTEQIKLLIADGWEPMGSHQVIQHHAQNRYRGDQLMDTIYQSEYTITMVREEHTNSEHIPNIEVGVYYCYEDDEETIKLFDEEEMRNEFETKLSQLINSK
ncbi:MAG: DUF1737 domain-containing protein [Sediminibacterium sp.]|jgi:Domain of unknown function (DUF1737)